METYFILIGIVMLLAGMGCGILRALRGPTPFDRVLAFDVVALNTAGLVIVISILLDTAAFIDVILVISLLGFLGTISIAAYLEGTLVDS
jgi:multicomponent Na+:H+ antiporter subunit F